MRMAASVQAQPLNVAYIAWCATWCDTSLPQRPIKIVSPELAPQYCQTAVESSLKKTPVGVKAFIGNIGLNFLLQMYENCINRGHRVKILPVQVVNDADLVSRLQYQRTQGFSRLAAKPHTGSALHNQPQLIGRVSGFCQPPQYRCGRPKRKIAHNLVCAVLR